MRIVEYDASRRADLAQLMGRVWGEPPSERELVWFYEQNPVRPASVLLAEEDGHVVGTVAMSFVRMSVGGEAREVGMPVRLATDPAYRGRGILTELQAESEDRAGSSGVRLLVIVPNKASAPIFLGRLGWTELPALRVWMRPRLPHRRLGAARVEHLSGGASVRTGDRVLRDAAWLNWRFAEAPRPYTLLERDGYAVVGRHGRLGVLAAVDGDLLGDAAAAASGPALIATPPPGELRRYALAGYVPTLRTFTLLGKSLEPSRPVPARLHFELGDLDFL